MENADVFLGLQDFLDRMRQPSATDFVKSIKSFIVSFSNNAPDPERDSGAVQDFLAKMESDFRSHPLWANCSQDELESSGEGLEKYVMTKLFTRVFASLPDDVNHDEQLSEKMALIQQFIRPENLDIKPNFQNETSWLLAQKELQKMNMYKAPRDKLVCILNCCRVISNLLHNASVASNGSTPGADEFLPVLIYVTIKEFLEGDDSPLYYDEEMINHPDPSFESKANPPQLYSNLLYIQRYRSQSRLVSEAAYYFTNMQSVESFISNIDAKALSMDEVEFEKNMETARSLLSGLSDDAKSHSNQTDQYGGQIPRPSSRESKQQVLNPGKDSVPRPKSSEKKVRDGKDQPSFAKIPSLSDLENKGAEMLLKDDRIDQVFQEYPYFFASSGDLTVGDVENLLGNYKQLVFKFVSLSKGLGITPKQEDEKTIDPTNESEAETENNVQLLEVESLEAKLLHQDEKEDESGKSEETTET